MTPVEHMAYGWTNPVLAYVFSFLGSLLALLLAIRARERTGGARVRALLLSATVLGSTGIWLMHFIAMLGFDVPTLILRYDLVRTGASLVVAVVMVACGLLVVGMGRVTWWRVGFGGLVTGLGVASMHYLGMAAINLGGTISYDRQLVVISVVFAVAASIVALYLAMVVRSGRSTVSAALAMALAASTMHYTGMAAVRVTPSGEVRSLPGVSPASLLVPITLLACLLVVGLFYAVAGMSINAESDLRQSGRLLRPAGPPERRAGSRARSRAASRSVTYSSGRPSPVLDLTVSPVNPAVDGA